MAEKKIIRKVIIPVGKPVVVEEPKVEKQPEVVEETESRVKLKKVCAFCQNKLIPSYTDLATLRRFLTDRAKIVAKERSGVCAKHQRGVAKNIKYARHLSLLPFVPKI